MSFKQLEIRPAARQDFDEASDWYRDQDPLIRDKFVAAVRNTFTAITQRPLSFPVVFASTVRRATVGKFPFTVFFRLNAELIIVVAVFHDKRNPIIWHGRID